MACKSVFSCSADLPTCQRHDFSGNLSALFRFLVHMIHNDMSFNRFIHTVHMLRQRFVAPADFSVDRHLTCSNTCIISAALFAVNGDPNQPVRLPVWHLLFAFQKLDAFFNRAARMHSAHFNRRLPGIHINNNRCHIIKAQSPDPKTAMSFSRVALDYIKIDFLFLFSSIFKSS